MSRFTEWTAWLSSPLRSLLQRQTVVLDREADQKRSSQHPYFAIRFFLATVVASVTAFGCGTTQQSLAATWDEFKQQLQANGPPDVAPRLQASGLNKPLMLQLPPQTPGGPRNLTAMPYTISNGRIDIPNRVNSIIDFVLTTEGKLLLGRGHSVVSNGANWVAYAGRLTFDTNGSLIAIDNDSGHYTPPAGLAQAARNYLKNRARD